MDPATPWFRRYRGLATAAAVGLALVVAGCGQSPSPSPQPTQSAGQALPHESPAAGKSQSAISGGALFGGNIPLAQQEAKLGRKLAIVRIYDNIGDTFPGPYSQFLANGSTALVSLGSGPHPGSSPSYASIAAGQYDAQISSFLRSVNQAAVRYHLSAIYVTFQHEPDSPKHRYLGTPAQFVAAWDHVHQLAVSEHLDWNTGGRLHWVWIIIHGSFSNGVAAQYWPGPGETDGIGVDGYNNNACRVAKHHGHLPAKAQGWTTPGALFDPAIRFAASHGGLPVFIPEWGSDNPQSSGIQPSFIRQMQTFVTANPEIAAVLYWDSGNRCSYSVDSNPESVAALASMGHSGALQGRLASAR